VIFVVATPDRWRMLNLMGALVTTTRRCGDCDRRPAGRCGRCNATLCQSHAPLRGRRCAGCEADWRQDSGTRRALQHMFAPPAFVLAGGLTFGLLLPVLFALPFSVGAIVVAALATSAGFGAAVGACRLVESAARAQFLREHAAALPEARVLRLPPASRAPR